MSEFDLPARAPKRRLMKPGPRIVGVKYSIVPTWCLAELIDRPPVLAVVAALGAHTNPQGECWPSLDRIAYVCNRSEAWARQYLREAERMGIIDRVPNRGPSKRKRRSIRRRVFYEPGAAIPRREAAVAGAFALPWQYPFNDGRQAMHKGGSDMVVTSTRKIDPPVTQNEIARQQYELGVRGQQETAEATRLAHYSSQAISAKTGKPGAPDVSIPTMRKWLRLRFSPAKIRAHIDTVVAEVEGNVLPISMQDYREPTR